MISVTNHLQTTGDVEYDDEEIGDIELFKRQDDNVSQP